MGGEVSIINSFIGVLLVSLSDSSPPTSKQSTRSLPTLRHAVLGDALALISALFGAIWVIFMKVRIQDDSRVDLPLFFGLVGFCNMLLLWPIGLVLHLMGAENFELPRTKQDLYAIITNVRLHIFLV